MIKNRLKTKINLCKYKAFSIRNLGYVCSWVLEIESIFENI